MTDRIRMTLWTAACGRIMRRPLFTARVPVDRAADLPQALPAALLLCRLYLIARWRCPPLCAAAALRRAPAAGLRRRCGGLAAALFPRSIKSHLSTTEAQRSSDHARYAAGSVTFGR